MWTRPLGSRCGGNSSWPQSLDPNPLGEVGVLGSKAKLETAMNRFMSDDDIQGERHEGEESAECERGDARRKIPQEACSKPRGYSTPH